jgi:hypothetical protein
MTEESDFAETAAQVPIISAAWRFLVPFYRDKDLGTAGPHADEILRVCWAEWWADANRAHLEDEGHDLNEIVRVLAIGEVEHSLRPHF